METRNTKYQPGWSWKREGQPSAHSPASVLCAPDTPTLSCPDAYSPVPVVKPMHGDPLPSSSCPDPAPAGSTYCVFSSVPGPVTTLSLGPSHLPSWTGTCTVGLQGPATEGPETSVRNWDSPGGEESCGQISRSAALVNRTLGCLAQRKPERGRQGVPQGPHHVPALLLLPSPSSGPGGGSSPMVRCGPVGSVTAWWQPGTQRLGHVQPPGPRAAAQGFQEPTCKRRDRHLTPRLTT